MNKYKITKKTPLTKTDIHKGVKGYSLAKYILNDIELKSGTEIFFKAKNEFSIYEKGDLQTYAIEKESA